MIDAEEEAEKKMEIDSEQDYSQHSPEQLEDHDEIFKVIKVDILYNHNQVLASGMGNTRKQAERNASIYGLRWLESRGLAPSNIGQFGSCSDALSRAALRKQIANANSNQ